MTISATFEELADRDGTQLPIAPEVGPALRYFGAKWRLAPEIFKHLPRPSAFVDVFGGSGAMLLRRPDEWEGRVRYVYNDANRELFNLHTVLQCPDRAPQLIAQVWMTIYSEAVLQSIHQLPPTDDAIERAWRLLVKGWMSFGQDGATSKKVSRGFRTIHQGGKADSARVWAKIPGRLLWALDRFRGISIVNRDWRKVLADYMRHQQLLIYADPPYLSETRGESGNYGAFEFDEAAHVELLAELNTAECMAAISGYDHPIYNKALADWERIEIKARTQGNRGITVDRTEVLWINPAAVATRKNQRGETGLFSIAVPSDLETEKCPKSMTWV